MDEHLVKESSRMQAYADTIFSIVATVMILPIAHTEVPEDTPLEKELEHYVLPQLLVYTGCFFLICNIWTNHVLFFQIVEKIDEYTVLLNIAMMLVITFFPFTFTLLANYAQTPLAIQLFCGTVILVDAIQFIYVLYAFRNWRLLAPHVHLNHRLKAQRNQMLFSLSTPIVMAALAALVCPLSVAVADFFLVSILFGNIIRRTILKVYRKCVGLVQRPELQISVEDEPAFHQQLLSKVVSKERLECFSDGVFAIVATLIILDICEKNVPSLDDVKEMGSLARALAQYSTVFLAYAATFSTVGLLWYVHHSLIHQVKELNLLMTFFNNVCLLSVGVMPLAFKLVTKYEDPAHVIYRNANLSIQFNLVIVFLVGIFQCAVWVAALYKQNKYLKPAAHYGTPEHYYTTAKLLVCPVTSLIVYLVSLGPSIQISVEVFNGLQLGWLGVFLGLQICYRFYHRHCKSSLVQQEFIDPDFRADESI